MRFLAVVVLVLALLAAVPAAASAANVLKVTPGTVNFGVKARRLVHCQGDNDHERERRSHLSQPHTRALLG